MGIAQAFRAGLLQGVRTTEDRYQALKAERDALLAKVVELETALVDGVGPSAPRSRRRTAKTINMAASPKLVPSDNA